MGKALKEFGQAGAHSMASGTFSHLQGGNVRQGAASGSISSLEGSGMQALKFGDPAMIAGSAASGGLGSKLSGGGFWQGERGCSSHANWLVAEMKRSYRPAVQRGASSVVRNL
ncbi:MAG: hypothetical protein IPM26_09630 [Saprospiraceae bacterium]|nr:hypothetical protein [Saprospiraceae bacterium]